MKLNDGGLLFLQATLKDLNTETYGTLDRIILLAKEALAHNDAGSEKTGPPPLWLLRAIVESTGYLNEANQKRKMFIRLAEGLGISDEIAGEDSPLAQLGRVGSDED